MSDDEYGPSLPPGFNKPSVKQEVNKNVSTGTCKDTESRDIGPCLPGVSNRSHIQPDVIGPILPPGLSGDKSSNVIGPSFPPTDSELEGQDVIGPMMPPGLSRNKKSGDIGPCLPQSETEKRDSNVIGPCLPQSSRSNSQTIGPSLPPGIGRHDADDNSDSEEEGCIGPLPSEMSSMEDDKNYTAIQFEKRAKLMKDRLEGKEAKTDEKLQRESWMMELPSAGLAKSIGLTARTFRANAAPDLGDRSAWTDTPADRERKEKEALEGKSSDRRKDTSYVISDRDRQMSEEVQNYNKSKRPQSLLEMHEKERKKLKKEKANEPKVRRPFDREVDLQTNRFDEAQRQSIIKKSQDLNNRFSKGKFTSQFL